MEGLTRSPPGIAVEVGESHRATSRNECTSRMERRLHKRSKGRKQFLFLSLSHTAEGSGMGKGAPAWSGEHWDLVLAIPLTACATLDSHVVFCLSSLIYTMARLG